MNTISLAKQELRDALAQDGDLRVSDYIPARLAGREVVITSNDPYVTPSERFNQQQVRLELSCIGPVATNAVSTDAVDELICKVLIALEETQWHLEEVSGHFGLESGSAVYLAARVKINRDVNIEHESAEGDED